MKFRNYKIKKANDQKRCIFCEIVSYSLGKRFFMFLLNRKWDKIYKKDIENHIKDLGLQVVGGINKRGWTEHDIDVIGNQSDVAIFSNRIKNAMIKNPVHYCGSDMNHSHLECLWNGIKLIFGK